MAYADLGDLRGYLDIVDASDDAILQEALDDAKAWIDGYTNRVFEAVTQTRYYQRDAIYWRGKHLLVVDRDLLTITTLTNGDADATAIPATEYWLWPRNDTPYWGIRLETDSAYDWEFDTDYWVSVAGTWGYSATCPDDIRRAALHLAAFFYRQKDSQVFVTTAMPEAGVITIPQGIPATVMRVVERYQKHL